MEQEPTLKISEYGNKTWWLHGQWHREDGPAVEWLSGTKEWYVNGNCHRVDGPAVEWASGKASGKAVEWWLDGCLMDFQEWKQEVRKYYDNQEDYLLMLLKLD